VGIGDDDVFPKQESIALSIARFYKKTHKKVGDKRKKKKKKKREI